MYILCIEGERSRKKWTVGSVLKRVALDLVHALTMLLKDVQKRTKCIVAVNNDNLCMG